MRWYEPKGLVCLDRQHGEDKLRMCHLRPRGCETLADLWSWAHNMLHACSVRWQASAWKDRCGVVAPCHTAGSHCHARARSCQLAGNQQGVHQLLQHCHGFWQRAFPLHPIAIKQALANPRYPHSLLITVPNDYHYCAHVQREHSHNHPYFLLKPDHIEIRCHSQQCAGKRIDIPLDDEGKRLYQQLNVSKAELQRASSPVRQGRVSKAYVPMQLQQWEQEEDEPMTQLLPW